MEKIKVKKVKRSAREAHRREVEATALRLAESLKAGNPLPLPDAFDQYLKADGNDLDAIGEAKGMALAVLGARLALGKWGAALELVGCRWDTYACARRKSKTYRHVADLVEEEIKNKRAALIEDSLFDQAVGDKVFKKGCLPPDSKAAQLYLGGNIERYKPTQQTQAQQVVINLNHELLGGTSIADSTS